MNSFRWTSRNHHFMFILPVKFFTVMLMQSQFKNFLMPYSICITMMCQRSTLYLSVKHYRKNIFLEFQLLVARALFITSKRSSSLVEGSTCCQRDIDCQPLCYIRLSVHNGGISVCLSFWHHLDKFVSYKHFPDYPSNPDYPRTYKACWFHTLQFKRLD